MNGWTSRRFRRIAATAEACGASGEGSGALIVVEPDSVGVRNVTLADVYKAPLSEWSIEERLTIGQPTASPEYELYRVEDATVLDDGSIAVANRGSSEVRILTATGT